jgi:LemA protein
MQGGIDLIWIAVFVLAGLLGFVVASYNGLVKLRQLLKNSWADVDVYLKRRADLIPNLVTAVKAYASHEETVLTALAEARARATSLSGPTLEHAAAETAVATGLVRVMMLAENYPDLKASGNFLDLQKELTETERQIASARQYYNAVVRDLNTKIEAFPSNLVAGMMGLRQAEFFETESAEDRIAPSVA